MKMLTLTLCAALLATGCVSSGTYEALQKDHAAAKARISTLEGELQRLKDERDNLVNSVDALQAEKARMLKDQSQMASSIQDMERALAELERRERQADARVAEFRRLIDRFKPLIDTGKLRVKIVDGRMVVELATDVLFASGKADLSEDGTAAIQEVAGLLASLGDKRFQVEGHTDNVPIANARFPSNWELAAARALTVVKTMVEVGLPANRVSGASFGEFKPAVSNDTDEGKARNRRIEIVLVPDLSGLPGFDELKKIGEPNG